MRRSGRAAVAALAISLLGAGALPVSAQEVPAPAPVPEDPGPIPTPTPSPQPLPLPPSPSSPDPAWEALPEPVELREIPEPQGPVADPTPRVRALMAEIAAIDTVGRVAEQQAALDHATEVLGAVAAEAALARTRVVEARDGFQASAHLRTEMAVAAYVRGGGAVSPAEASFGTYEQRRTQVLADAVVEHQTGVISERQDAIGVAEAELRERESAVAEVAAVVGEHTAALAAATQAVADAQAELPRARAADGHRMFDPASPGPWELTIVGESLFTAEDLAAFVSSRAVGSRASAPMADIATFFVEEGRDEQIRGDVAFAQAVLETGWFTNDDTARFNNYAGVGHCDTCPTGWSFPSAREGVRAQIQLLKSYVEVRPTYLHPLVDGRLRGPAGCCTTWNGLTGVWATTQIYGPLVLGIYQQMLEWLLARRLSGTP